MCARIYNLSAFSQLKVVQGDAKHLENSAFLTGILTDILPGDISYIHCIVIACNDGPPNIYSHKMHFESPKIN